MHRQAEWFRKKGSERTAQSCKPGSEKFRWSSLVGPNGNRKRHFLVGPTERGVEKTILNQLPNMGDPLETRSLEVFEHQTDLLIGFEQFDRALPGIPDGLELGQNLADFAAIHAVAALVGAGI